MNHNLEKRDQELVMTTIPAIPTLFAAYYAYERVSGRLPDMGDSFAIGLLVLAVINYGILAKTWINRARNHNLHD